MPERVCRHCGVEVRLINWALGPKWEHSPYPHHTRDAYEFCHATTAEPAPSQCVPDWHQSGDCGEQDCNGGAYGNGLPS